MNNRGMMFAPLGDSAVVVKLGDSVDPAVLAAVSELAAALRTEKVGGVRDIVPAYGTVAVFYEPGRWTWEDGSPYERVCRHVASVAEKLAGGLGAKIKEGTGARRVEIPVCYGGESGPDLAAVAAHAGLREAEVIARHAGAVYRVQAIGFAPGFPYLSGLPAELAVPRRATPRAKVPAGAVGIGGAQTGVYPRESPGGWQLIGRTPWKLFDAARAEPAMLRVGDAVAFRAITREELASWK